MHDFARDWSVRNSEIFCEYNFPPSPPGVETIAQKPRQALPPDAPEIHSFPDKAGAEKGQEQLNGTDEL